LSSQFGDLRFQSNESLDSDSPIRVDAFRWIETLRQYKIDGHLLFDPADATAQHTWRNMWLLRTASTCRRRS
jgi:hypothetical protein